MKADTNTKAYIMYGGDCHVYDDWIYGVYLDKEKCATDKVKLNAKHDEHKEQFDICCKCCQRSDDGDNDFKNKDSCELSIIKEDRNGLYCENDHTGCDFSADYYYYIKVRVIE